MDTKWSTPGAKDTEAAPRRWTLPAPWREAAVFGALWGAIELTLGTFLHTTRIPLAGLFMSMSSVALLTASMMLIQRPGFPLRTALVCAALRALSPEGLMLGPMIAIVWQGTLVTLAFMILKRPLIAGIISGFFATLSTQFQAFITRLVAYGADFWELLIRLIEQAESFLGLETGQGWIAVILYLTIGASLGVLAGIAGWWVGRQALQIRERR